MQEYKLPSGAKLRITLAPFKEGKELYQAILKEFKSLKVSEKDQIDVNMFKDIFCTLLSSNEIESAILKCAERCLYDNSKINDETFEDENARQDYIETLYLIAEANIRPFVKALFAKYYPMVQGAMEKFRG